MKLKSLLIAPIAAVAMLSSCGSDQGTSLADLRNASAADSVMYIMGESRASDYWRQAQQDSTFATEKTRQAYLAGVKAAAKLVRNGDDAYNQGLMLGLQLALQSQQFEKIYGMKVNAETAVDGLAYGLRSDSTVNETELQTMFYGIMGRLDQIKAENDKAKSDAALSKEASKLGYTKISDSLYGKVEKAGQGAAVKAGEKVNVKIVMTKKDGASLGIPMPEQLEVGDKYVPAPLTSALEGMKVGETKKFATTGHELFGARSQQMGLEADDIILFTIEVKGIAAAEAPAEAPAQAQ